MSSSIYILQTTTFLDLLASGLLAPQLPNQARALGSNHILVGIMVALYTSSQLISTPAINIITNAKSKRSTLFYSLCLSGLAYMSLGLTSSVAVFLALRAFIGLVKQSQTLIKAVEKDYKKDAEKHTDMFNKLSTISGTGLILGPIFSGYIMDTNPTYGFTILSLIVALIYAINAGLISKLPLQEPPKKTKEKLNKVIPAPKLIDSATTNIKLSLEELFKLDWSLYSDVFLLDFLITTCMTVFFQNFVLFLKIKHKMNAIGIGYMVSLAAFINSASSFFMSHNNDYYRDDKKFTHRAFYCFFALTIALLGVTSASSIFVYTVFFTMLILTGIVGRFNNLQMIEAIRGSKVSLGPANSMRSLNAIYSPILAGVIAQYLGILNVIYFCILLAIAGSYLSYKLKTDIDHCENKKE